MKFPMLLAAAATAGALVAMPAAAQIAPTYYGNLGYTAIDGDNVDLGAVTGRLGVRAHRYFGAEAEAAFGVNDDSQTIGGVKATAKLKHSFAAYGVGFLPLNDKVELLARVGYGTTKVRASAGGFGASSSDESWNYGVGAQYVFDGANGVRVDYTRHDFDGGKADTWAVSYVRKF